MEIEEKTQKYELCNVGPFSLPGVVFDKESVDEEQLQEMIEWAEQNNCGMLMTDRLWSFRKESQRDMFILRWS